MNNEIVVVTKTFGKELVQNTVIAVAITVTYVVTLKLATEISDRIEYRNLRRTIKKNSQKV